MTENLFHLQPLKSYSISKYKSLNSGYLCRLFFRYLFIFAKMDNELLYFSKMQEGDISAFEYFFNKYSESLYLYAFGYVKDNAVAEDLVQEVFVYVWENRKRIELHESLLGYMMRAVRNACINLKEHLRAKQNYLQRQVLKEVADEPYEVEDLQKLHQKLMASIEKLPTKCREIFKLACIEGLEYIDVAEQCEVSVNTVKTQVKIAYRKLRADLNIPDDSLRILLVIFKIGI